MTDLARFSSVRFRHFKAFETFTLNLRGFNILVGPNNAGKSTILSAFRILAAAMRKANTRKPEIVTGPEGPVRGYATNLTDTSVAEENIFHNYKDDEPAIITFRLSNNNELILYFPEVHSCYLILNSAGRAVTNPTLFRREYNCPIGFVPILGPVEQHEQLYDREAARRALFNYRAARNFRNIWHHYPENFDRFREAIVTTWPGMDIEQPVIERRDNKAFLYMFCPEERIPREIFWSGFGFQVWCQMLTHLIQSSDAALFLIDEPDIYLHSDLQRQLLSILRNLGPDTIVATHSIDIISDAEPDDIVLINKKRRHGKRIKRPSDLHDVFSILGSGLNPVLTQLAKTRKCVFVEGKDFQILSKFATKAGAATVGTRRDFAVVPIEGFNPERARQLIAGMQTTLGGSIKSAVILDRDYRSQVECDTIKIECDSFCDMSIIHRRKEIENFLLVPTAIDRAAAARVADRAKRGGMAKDYANNTQQLLESLANEKKGFIFSRYLAERKRFERRTGSRITDERLNEEVYEEFENLWENEATRLAIMPGKEALAAINESLQKQYKVSVTPTAIIDSMRRDEIPEEVIDLVGQLADFAKN